MKSIRFNWLAGALLLGSVPAGALAPKTVGDGIQAWQRSDYATAVAIWTPLAEKGDPDAAFNLGQAYRLGRAVAVDLSAAQRWLEKAARAGHLDAQTTLGLLLFDSGSREAALRWLKQAAERGEPRAMLVYGTALFNGDGVEREPALAYAYVSRAASQGLQPAKTTLKEMDAILPAEVRRKGLEIALKSVPEKSPPPAPSPATKPAKAVPAPAPSPVKSVPVASEGSWRIQLGAFSKRSSAEALYKKLASTPAIAGREPVYVAAGAVTRLQVGGFASKAAAQSACAALSAKGQACFPVAGK